MATMHKTKLYIAHDDLKERYQSEVDGMKRLKAYVQSVEDSRNIFISVNRREVNGTVEFELESGQDSELAEAKSDIQGEVCSPSAAKKYDQPPRYLPSTFIRQKSVSKEAAKEKSTRDQAKKPSALTLQALEKHDRMTDSGPCSLRQFACGVCHLSWWRVVLKKKPVSRCKGVTCGKMRYDALPKDRQFGIGRCLCPNEACKREFFVYCEASERFACRKCKTQGCQPYVHPKWRKKAAKRNSSQLNPRARDFVPQSYPRHSGPHFEPSASATYYGDGDDGEGSLSQSFSSLSTQDTSRQRMRRRAKRRIFNASQPHIPTNSTISTFLSQVDFEQIGEDVDLDYGSDEEDEERVGVCKFECDCGNKYTSLVRMRDRAKCYECNRLNNPLRWAPPRDIEKHSDAKHSCTRCYGREHCPNLEEAAMYKEE